MNIASLLFLFVIRITAAATADYLVVENPRALRIYNNYEQRLSDEALSLFTHFVPLEILQENILLSDNFSGAYSVKLHEQIYYLLCNSEGELTNIKNAGFVSRYSKAKSIGDTVRLLRSGEIFIQEPRGTRTKQYFDKGHLLARIFEHRGKIFVTHLDSVFLSGWSNINHSTAWQKVHKQGQAEQQVSEVIRQRLEEKFAGINRTLAELFDTMRRTSGRDAEAPRWIMEISSTLILCRLDGKNSDLFEKSTAILTADLRDLLSGLPVIITPTMNSIQIRFKTD